MDNLLEAINKARAQLPKNKPLLGLFCNIRVLKRLKDNYANTPDNSYFGADELFFGAPIWIDNRLSDEQSEAYYDPELLKKRIKEQNEYDNSLRRSFLAP